MDKINLLPQDDVLAAEVSARPRAEREPRGPDLLEAAKAVLDHWDNNDLGVTRAMYPQDVLSAMLLLRDAAEAEDVRIDRVLEAAMEASRTST